MRNAPVAPTSRSAVRVFWKTADSEVGATHDPEGSGYFFLRTPSHFDPVSGAATMFGSLERNSTVRVCTAKIADVLDAVDETVQTLHRPSFFATGALVVSCAGRRWVLDERSHEEVDRVFSGLGRQIPLAGLPSFGEIGPFFRSDGSYTPTFFHNVTFVSCLFGQ